VMVPHCRIQVQLFVAPDLEDCIEPQLSSSIFCTDVNL
jgi:hypothetical protein